MAEEDDAVEDAGGSEDGGDVDLGDVDLGDVDLGDVDLGEEVLKMMEEEGGEDDEGENSPLLPGGDGLGGADFGREDPGGDTGSGVSPSVARLMDVPLLVTIELGGAEMTLADVMELGEQSLVELNKSHGEPVDVKVNGKLFARGEVVVVAENFGVRITQLLPGGLSI